MKYHTFLPRFHLGILERAKRTTIRGSTRVHAGERFALRHWTGKPYRSPMGFLGTATCDGVRKISVYRDGVLLEGIPGIIGGHQSLNEIARCDGFDCWEHMRIHFEKRLPVHGVLIAWGDSFVEGAP